MTSILGIDAAWSPKNPSGVALVVQDGGRWRCKALSPSYDGLIEISASEDAWRKPSGGEAKIPRLVGAAKTLAGGHPPSVIAVDMPLAAKRINGRRVADQKVSQCLGRYKCAVHSPTSMRPGKLGQRFAEGLMNAGYPLATTLTDPGTYPCAIEVYPHASIVRLMNLDERLKYKVSRSVRLWPGSDVQQRIGHLISAFQELRRKLGAKIEDITLPLPDPSEVQTLSSLKPYEDSLDALVCAWTGIRYIEGGAEAFGDETAAIWVPKA